MKQLRAYRSGTFHDRFTPPVCAPSFERAQQSPSVHSYAAAEDAVFSLNLVAYKISTRNSAAIILMIIKFICMGLKLQIRAKHRAQLLNSFLDAFQFHYFDRLLVAGQFRQSGMRATTPSNAIISSIEFDVDGACFATAGVSKRIQIFDFRDVCGESSIWPPYPYHVISIENIVFKLQQTHKKSHSKQ